MAELKLAPEPETSRTKGIVIAAIALVAVAVAVFLLNPHKVAEVSVTKVQVFAPQSKFDRMRSSGGLNVIAGPQVESDLYVVATVRIDNKLRLPIFLSAATAGLVQPDGSEMPATVVLGSNLQKLELSFPEIAAMAPQPLTDGSVAQPKGSVEGQLVMMFPGVDESVWKTKKSASVTLDLAHQGPITVALP